MNKTKISWVEHHPEDNPKYSDSRYKKGKIIDSSGYAKIRLPQHPYAAGGYVYEHRLIIERILKRYLLPKEIVHHKNGNKQDNSPDNLLLLKSIGEHKLEHRHPSERRKPGEPNSMIPCRCGCNHLFLKYDASGRPREYIKGHFHRTSKHKLNILINCACGCGEIINKYDIYGRERKFISGHNGRKVSICLLK